MKKNATKMTGFVVAIFITFIFAMATSVVAPVFAYATDSAMYTEEPESLPRVDDDGGDFIEEGEWYHYYDFNNDGKVNVSDLVIIKEAVDERGTLSIFDYKLVYEYVLTGTWESKMHLVSSSIDNKCMYNEETSTFMRVSTNGELVDIQIEGDVLMIRYLNGCVITEIRISHRNPYFARPIVYLDDVIVLQNYLLTGEWQNKMQYEVTDLSNMEYSPECVDIITSLTYGQLVDYHINNATGKIWLRFLNDCTIQEVIIPRDDVFVKIKDITLREQYGDIISIGITSENRLGWNWLWNYVEVGF